MKLEIVGPKQHIVPLINGDSNTVSTESFSPKTWGDVLEQPAATDTRRLSKIVNTSLISALVRPALKRREDLSRAIAQIGYAPLTAEKLKKAEKNFRSLIGAPDVGQQAELWLAICLRMRGHNATDAFRKVLKREPSNRIAFLNVAANYLTFPKGRCDAARQTFSELKMGMSLKPPDPHRSNLNQG